MKRLLKSVNLNLNRGDSVSGTLSVTGGTGTGVDFMVSDPNGKDLLSYNYTSYTSFLFSASITGTYDLIFNNSFCSCEGGKNVTLNYSVNDKTAQGSLEVTSKGGFPTIIILILISASVAIVAVVILMRHQKTKTDTAMASPQATRTLTAHIFLCACRRVQNDG